jgi:hypothetical protein
VCYVVRDSLQARVLDEFARVTGAQLQADSDDEGEAESADTAGSTDVRAVCILLA